MPRKIEKLIWVLVGLVVVAVAISVALSLLFPYYGGTGGGSYYGMMGYPGGYFYIMPVMAAIGVVMVVVFLYFFMEIFFPDRNGHYMERETPMDILKRRYANGDITKEEYEAMRKDL
jgi:putative membrane protein